MLGISGEQAYRVPSMSLPNSNQVPTPSSVWQLEAVPDFLATVPCSPARTFRSLTRTLPR